MVDFGEPMALERLSIVFFNLWQFWHCICTMPFRKMDQNDAAKASSLFKEIHIHSEVISLQEQLRGCLEWVCNPVNRNGNRNVILTQFCTAIQFLFHYPNAPHLFLSYWANALFSVISTVVFGLVFHQHGICAPIYKLTWYIFILIIICREKLVRKSLRLWLISMVSYICIDDVILKSDSLWYPGHCTVFYRMGE